MCIIITALNYSILELIRISWFLVCLRVLVYRLFA